MKIVEQQANAFYTCHDHFIGHRIRFAVLFAKISCHINDAICTTDIFALYFEQSLIINY